jgi:hypothetical protein
MISDHQKMAAAVIRHRAQELKKLRVEEGSSAFSRKPSAGWTRVSEGIVLIVAEVLEDIAKEMLSGTRKT